MPEQNCNIEITLRHSLNWEAKMTVEPDSHLGEDLVAFSFTCNDEPIILVPQNEQPIENQHFQIDKQQVAHLIDFLQRIYNGMP